MCVHLHPTKGQWTLTYQTLTVFLASILSKKYTNPSADIITVLAGLDQVDAVFLDFANAIEATIRSGRSREFLFKLFEIDLGAHGEQWIRGRRQFKQHCR